MTHPTYKPTETPTPDVGAQWSGTATDPSGMRWFVTWDFAELFKGLVDPDMYAEDLPYSDSRYVVAAHCLDR